MKKLNSKFNISLLILTFFLFGISFVLIGCGENSRPSVQATNDDLNLTVGSRKVVEVYITDTDDNDTHTISASSENTTVAAVSVNEITHNLTITGTGVGSTTIRVTATDDSGHDNASVELVFDVTVIKPRVVALNLAVRSRRVVEVYITDTDDNDTHTISASSENTTVAAVSVNEITHNLTITGTGVGSTTIRVTATDDSGHDNASVELVIDVTVIEPRIVASAALPLSELSVKERVVTLTLFGLIYESDYRFGDSIAVDGFIDVGTFEYSVHRVSDTQIVVRFHGSFDAYDGMLNFIVKSSGIAEYEGPPLSVQLPVIEAVEVPGPWLWMAAPTNRTGVSTEIDSLAEASNNGVTETDVAKKGVNEGDIIGQFQWTSGWLSSASETCEEFCSLVPIFGGCGTLCWLNNIKNLLTPIGLGIGGNIQSDTAYALINAVSPSDQAHAAIGIKSGDEIKMWLNGEVIDIKAATNLGCRSLHVPLAFDPWVCTPDPDSLAESVIPVKLKAGDNLLLIKVRQHGDYWGMVVRLAADFTTAIPTR